MYQALYRKWRPQTFDEVVGQQHITETLKNQLISGRTSHAYLFIGSRGTGKTTCARILAKALNCENPVGGNPCGKCAACRSIGDGSALEIVELDAASNSGVDHVRALRDEAVFSPAALKKRIYIIDEVHMLSTSAFNALLKILEEPPAHLVFILATTELHKVPATVLSRCQRHNFRRIDSATIAEHLEYIARQEGMKLSHEAAELLARRAEGGLRDALSLLDQCSASENIDAEAVYSAIGLAGSRLTAELLQSIIRQDAAAALRTFDRIWVDGKDPMTVLSELSTLIRDIMLMHVAPKGGQDLLSGAYSTEELRAFASALTTEQLICALNTVQRYIALMRESKNIKTTAEICLISLCDSLLGEDVDALRARVSRLEQQLAGGVVMQPAPLAATEPQYEEPPLPEEPYFPKAPVRHEAPEEDDELDISAFAEEQPEDAFLERPAREEPKAAPVSDAGDIWQRICERVKPELPMGKRSLMTDKAVRGRLNGDELRIEVTSSFLFGQFKDQTVLNKFAAAARELTEREIRVTIGELKQEQREKRDLNELRAFPEVRFTK